MLKLQWEQLLCRFEENFSAFLRHRIHLKFLLGDVCIRGEPFVMFCMGISETIQNRGWTNKVSWLINVLKKVGVKLLIFVKSINFANKIISICARKLLRSLKTDHSSSWPISIFLSQDKKMNFCWRGEKNCLFLYYFF